MARSNRRKSAALVDDIKQLADVLDDALGLLNARSEKNPAISNEVLRVQSSLFDQCIAMCRQGEMHSHEPIRTIHHLSCTGGTLITKCLAAMPNVMVLNEVDPLSTFSMDSNKPEFRPTDIIALLRQGDIGIENTLIVELFMSNLRKILDEMRFVGRRLVVRDHSHSHYLTQTEIDSRPSLLNLLDGIFDTRSIVTVRDPIDSYLSLQAMEWLTFEPTTFDEYCRRYHMFLDDHEDIELFRYEDFVVNPLSEMKKMCLVLGLTYTSEFVDTFDVFKLSGDSGRSGGHISRRPRRVCSGEFEQEVKLADNYASLVSRLGYKVFS